jgi:hypothetical protein
MSSRGRHPARGYGFALTPNAMAEDQPQEQPIGPGGAPHTDADIERPARTEVESDGRGAEMLLLTPSISMLHDSAQCWVMWAEHVAHGSPRRRSLSYCK